MKLPALLAISLFASACGAEMRELQTGNDLLHNIKEGKAGNDFASFYTTGYIRGVTDSLVMIGSLCPTTGVDMAQYTDIVQKYLEKNPETRNEAALVLTFLAVGQAFPCKKKIQ
ncbi:TPA: hypothetical protein N6X18_000691 [Escherichia coli]|nr:hypothetical protein [Escherichia coli]